MKYTAIIPVLVLLTGCQGDAGDIASLGTLEVHRVAVAADSSEPIIEMNVKEGDEVQAGQVLAQQDPARIKANLAQARAQAQAAADALKKALNGARKEDVDAARANVAAARADAKTARLELDRQRSLVKQNFASKNNVDVLQGQYEAAVARGHAASAALEKLLAGTRPEDIAAARNAVAAANAQVAAMKLSLDRTTIRAPVAGKVEAIIERVGERPQPGGAVLILSRHEQPYARVNVPEPLRTRLAPGAAAEVRIDGYDKPFPAKLRWIAHDASYTPFFALTQHDRSHLSYLADVELTGKVGNLPTGVAVQVYFPGLK